MRWPLLVLGIVLSRGATADSVEPPKPDVDLAVLPTDARSATSAAWGRAYRKHCGALRARPCELVADLDGDGKTDRVMQIRERGGARAGIAIAWGTRGVSTIAAGASSRTLRVEVFEDHTEQSWNATDDDLEEVLRWAIVPRTADGFDITRFAPHTPPTRAGAKRPPRRIVSTPAPSATGAGIWVAGGDAAQILYWDGTGWRQLIML